MQRSLFTLKHPLSKIPFQLEARIQRGDHLGFIGCCFLPILLGLSGSAFARRSQPQVQMSHFLVELALKDQFWYVMIANSVLGGFGHWFCCLWSSSVTVVAYRRIWPYFYYFCIVTRIQEQFVS
ncbi:uncharacterized protein LOC107875913 [Capsicum annuum]|uniref:uncharacterized protein LOC107875913 n=1 Tax=Capsicum annuum TaxID=4072 RepID=UPI001FB11DE5|nr:uncharacterized protein LOC107875913 [Capsicum annuum]